MAVLGVLCCLWALSSCGEQGLLFIVVRGLLIAVASLVGGARASLVVSCGFSSFGSRALEPRLSSCGTWA